MVAIVYIILSNGFTKTTAKNMTAAMAANTSIKAKTSHHVQSAAITTRASSSADRRRHGRMSFWRCFQRQEEGIWF